MWTSTESEDRSSISSAGSHHNDRLHCRYAVVKINLELFSLRVLTPHLSAQFLPTFYRHLYPSVTSSCFVANFNRTIMMRSARNHAPQRELLLQTFPSGEDNERGPGNNCIPFSELYRVLMLQERRPCFRSHLLTPNECHLFTFTVACAEA